MYIGDTGIIFDARWRLMFRAWTFCNVRDLERLADETLGRFGNVDILSANVGDVAARRPPRRPTFLKSTVAYCFEHISPRYSRMSGTAGGTRSLSSDKFRIMDKCVPLTVR